jgi:hypothetical protein
LQVRSPDFKNTPITPKKIVSEKRLDMVTYIYNPRHSEAEIRRIKACGNKKLVRPHLNKQARYGGTCL